MKILRAAAAATILLTGISAHAEPERATLIRGARVFDGSGAPAVVENVLVRGERIVAVAPKLRAPRGARVIDARGLTLTPGLHDLHTHLRSPAYDAPDDMAKSWAGYLVNGVTSVNDYSVSGEMLAPIREMSAPGGIPAPHLQLAIRLGVPGGHGTEFGWGNFFTMQVATPRAAHVAMAQALPYRPDVIKVFADGWRYGRDADLNSMNEPTLAAIVADAHKAGLPVITHTVTLEGAKVAAAAGVDAVGHGVGDVLVDDELIGLMKAHHTAYIATLVVYEPQEDRTFDPGEWASFTPPEQARETARIAKPAAPIPAYEAKRWAIMQENIRRLKAAGIPIGIGTDAGIEGVYHGPGALREISWLSKLGLTPSEALVAATSGSAAIIGQDKDHGRIAAGQRADLVLYAGQPDQRIADLWKVSRVFVAGREAPLAALRAALASSTPTALPVHKMAGPIDSGVRSDGRTDLDTLPVESTEAGVDHSHLDFVRPDEGADRRLFMVAHLGARPRPFAQLILPLTRGAVELADARGFTGVAFDARGAGDYVMMFDSYGLDDDARFKAGFTAGAATREIRLPFSAFRGSKDGAVLDLASLRALIVRLQGEPGGKAWLQLSNIRFY
ncbi:amidohydrolase family protein [Sphingomonas sp. AR_OL41]|uniref:amidohydrolase family protein n=1 Tax=Sphingomonas sp. AR_OL41 TaxID=3042729 RepID=UPI0024804521|nr:amidohydrolase family protein [Sphingomonas sp. AR_OL41]MDH7971162.1 amidohydrolase family protein [Sphingomonas sp. AR_OL41]